MKISTKCIVGSACLAFQVVYSKVPGVSWILMQGECLGGDLSQSHKKGVAGLGAHGGGALKQLICCCLKDGQITGQCGMALCCG